MTALVFVVLIGTKALPRLLDSLGIENFALGIVVGVLVVNLISLVVDRPRRLGRPVVRQEVGPVDQTTRTFVLDQLKGLLVGTLLLSAVFIPVYAVIRPTDSWWIYATLLLMVVALLMAFVYPVLIMPIFNKFIPLEDDDLKHRIDAVADKAGVTIKGSFTMDASRRSRRDNAFVAGFGPTKRVVIFDTMLEHPATTVEHVVAHEIGHYRLQHIFTSVPAALVSTLLTFGRCRRSPPGTRSCASPGSTASATRARCRCSWRCSPSSRWGPACCRPACPATTSGRPTSRALRLLRDPGAMVDVWKRMAPKNIADLEPTWWKRLTASHPDAAERMAFAARWAQLNGVPVVAPPADAPPVRAKAADEEPAT